MVSWQSPRLVISEFAMNDRESRMSALTTPTFDVRYWVKFGKHFLI